MIVSYICSIKANHTACAIPFAHAIAFKCFNISNAVCDDKSSFTFCKLFKREIITVYNTNVPKIVWPEWAGWIPYPISRITHILIVSTQFSIYHSSICSISTDNNIKSKWNENEMKSWPNGKNSIYF